MSARRTRSPRAGRHPLPPQPLRSAALGLIQYTSGSTGDPKGVALSHANLLANIRAWGRAAALGPQDVCVSWLPLYHDMGLIGTWLGSLYHGRPLVLMSPLDFLARPERWLWAIHHYRGTVTAAPNFAFELCVRRLGRHRAGRARPVVLATGSEWRRTGQPHTLARFAAAFSRYGLDRAQPDARVRPGRMRRGPVRAPPGRGVVIDPASELGGGQKEGMANARMRRLGHRRPGPRLRTTSRYAAPGLLRPGPARPRTTHR